MQKKISFSGTTLAGYAGLLTGILLLVWLFLQIDLRASLDLVIDIGWLAPLLLLPYAALHILETIGWKKLFPVATGPIAFRRLFNIQLVSETVSMTVPAGVAVGEPLRPYLCKRFLGVPLPAAVAAVVIRKLVLGLSQGIYTLVGALLGFFWLQELSVQLIGIPGLGWVVLVSALLIIAVFVVLLLMLLDGGMACRLHGLLMAIPFTRLRRWLLRKENSFHETDSELKRFGQTGVKMIVVSTIYYTFAWMMLGVESYLILYLLGAEVAFDKVVVLDTSLTLLRSVVFVIPSGLGIQDFGFLAFFKALAMQDYVVVGGAFVLLRRLKELLWYAAGYALFLYYGIRPGTQDYTNIR